MKKGFTLVELVAVIAIIAILSLLVTPAVLKMRENLLESMLTSKINLINSAAKEYASDRIMNIPSPVSSDYIGNKNSKDNCYTVYVRVLISNGYLKGDSEDKLSIINPINEESLNNELVCVRYDTNDAMNRQIISYIIGEDSLYEN